LDLGWYGPTDWKRLGVNAEVRGWASAALDVTAGHSR
jgi:hypothetical protein